VNLDEVAQMLQRGQDVRVVDATTGKDITRLVLTQIIEGTWPVRLLVFPASSTRRSQKVWRT
jgi:hypothetical protein